MSDRTCAALTDAGKPCRNHRLNADGLCWRHDGRPAPEYKPRGPASHEPKTCRICKLLRPARMFRAGPTNPKSGVPYRVRTCTDCEEKARRAKGIPKRHVRRDARGFVWCNNCQHYLHPENFKRHPYRTHTYWAYCKDCTRALDRLRSKRIKGTPEWHADNERRLRQRRQRREAEHKERKHFVANAISLLLRRGLTKAEICRLGGVSNSSLLKWEHRARRATPNVEARFGVLLYETRHLPTGDQPCSRRRLPHPELPALAERIAPQLVALPVRSRWGRNALAGVAAP